MASTKPLTCPRLQLFKRLLFVALAVNFLWSLASIPLWVDTSRELFSEHHFEGHESPVFNPWTYSSVAVAQVAHLLVLFFGLAAAYDESPIKSALYSSICLTIAIALFVLMAFVSCPTHLIVTIVIQTSLAIMFAWFAIFVRREHLMNLNGGSPILATVISDHIERSLSRESYRSYH